MGHFLRPKMNFLRDRFSFPERLLRSCTSENTSTPLVPVLWLTNRLTHISSLVQLLNNHLPVPINIKRDVSAGVRRLDKQRRIGNPLHDSEINFFPVHQLFQQLSRQLKRRWTILQLKLNASHRDGARISSVISRLDLQTEHPTAKPPAGNEKRKKASLIQR